MCQSYAVIIKSSIQQAKAIVGEKPLALQLFERYFEIYPETLRYFEHTDLNSFAVRKFNTIAEFFVDTVESPSFAEDHVAFEVYRHISYDVVDKEYYFMMVETFKDVVIEALGDAVNEEIKTAWLDVSSAMKAHLQEGANLYL